MFTGIIEEMGVVKEVTKTQQGSSVSILAQTVLEGLKVGDSVTVNGACLTVVAFARTEMKADLSPETAKVTTLGSLKAGDPVNLERAMRLGDRIAGDRKSTRLNSSHDQISYAVFCLKKKNNTA